MEYDTLIITGTSGAGKSAVADRLSQMYRIFQLVRALTTRKSRHEDIPGQYHYVTEHEFEELASQGKLIVESGRPGGRYGIGEEELQQAIDNAKTPVLSIAPDLVDRLKNTAAGVDTTFLSVFVDAPDDVLERRLKDQGVGIDKDAVREERRKDREYGQSCDYVVTNSGHVNLDEVAQLIYFWWHHRNAGGMVPKNVITLMIKCGLLLEEAKIGNVEGASYDLTLGDEYYQRGRIKTLNQKNNFVVMEPGDYVLASSREIAALPKDVAGRFDISVGLFCQGVILSNGPQIDPGFRGRLFCLLFNTSNERVQLKRDAHYATIEFVKLTAPTTPYAGKYQNKLDLAHYLPRMVKESAINVLIDDVKGLKREKWWIKILPLVISLFAIALAIISLIKRVP